MPLNPNEKQLIRKNLKKARNGKKTYPVAIGNLTDQQLSDLTQCGVSEHGAHDGRIMFTGQHIHDRRVVVDGYSSVDVIDQIKNAISPRFCDTGYSKNDGSPECAKSEDGYGNTVRDEVMSSHWS